jgi:NAD(P)-dependent dehydrogenase (short-subunit alcohol dehydrogenase family)
MLRNDALSGKSILLTGGGSGLGLSMSKRFVELGARVFIVGRSQERLDEAVAAIGAVAPTSHTESVVASHACDVRDATSAASAVADAIAQFGRIDVLVNNAAGNFLAAYQV